MGGKKPEACGWAGLVSSGVWGMTAGLAGQAYLEGAAIGRG